MVAYSGFWKLFNNLYDSHRILEQPFFQIICLFLHLLPFTIRCWTFDVRCSSFSLSSLSSKSYVCFFIFPHSMFDVHLFQSLLGKNNLALMEILPPPISLTKLAANFPLTTNLTMKQNNQSRCLSFFLWR